MKTITRNVKPRTGASGTQGTSKPEALNENSVCVHIFGAGRVQVEVWFHNLLCVCVCARVTVFSEVCQHLHDLWVTRSTLDWALSCEA